MAFDSSVIDHSLETNHICFCYTLYRIFAEVLAVRLRETTQENMRLKTLLQPFLELTSPSSESSELPSENFLKNKKVLLVDHSLQARKILWSILKEFRFQEIIETKDKKQALKVLKHERIDIILTELNLPRGSGLELLVEVRNLSKTKHIPFIIITAETDQNKINKAIQAKVTHYLVKPITPMILFEKIKTSLEAEFYRRIIKSTSLPLSIATVKVFP